MSVAIIAALVLAFLGAARRELVAEPCALLHGNFANHKKFMEALKEDPTGASCRAVVRRFRRNDHLFRDHTPDARMLDMVGAKCCRGGGGGTGGGT